MTKNNKWLLVFVFSLAAIKCYSQKAAMQGYVIITYEQNFPEGIEKTHRTFWIVPEDSISDLGTRFSPLLLSGYFKNDIEDCCKGIGIDPYLSSPQKENYLDTAREKALEDLLAIIYKNRKKIQTIAKKWDTGTQEQTTIYGTSVLGSFCSSKFSITGQKRSSYAGLLYMPYDKIENNDPFWATAKGKLIVRLDFSKFDFDYNILFNVFPEWKKYGK